MIDLNSVCFFFILFSVGLKIVFLAKSSEGSLRNLIFDAMDNAIFFFLQFFGAFLQQSLPVLIALQGPLRLFDILALFLFFAHFALLLFFVLVVSLVAGVIGLEFCFQLFLVDL